MAVKPPSPTVVIEHPGTYKVPVSPKTPETLKVWSPDGVSEEHPVANARDLVRMCGYTYSDPRAPQKAPQRVGLGGMIAGTPGVEADEKQESNASLDALNTLRAKVAEALGGADKVDQRWGFKRLNEELEAASKKKPEVPASAEKKTLTLPEKKPET
jgi:hypothetical protein